MKKSNGKKTEKNAAKETSGKSTRIGVTDDRGPSEMYMPKADPSGGLSHGRQQQHYGEIAFYQGTVEPKRKK